MGRRRAADMTTGPTHRLAGGPKHHGLVTTTGSASETGHALWQASCSCGWRHPQVNSQQRNANRALYRHIKAVRSGVGTGAGTRG